MVLRKLLSRRLAPLEGLAAVAVVMVALVVIRRSTSEVSNAALTGTAGAPDGVGYLVNIVKGLSEDVALALWRLVTVLSGGPEGPWWRWVLVEEGLLVALIVAGGAIAATGLSVGAAALPSLPLVRWVPAVIVALPFGLLWTAYGLMQAQAMNVLVHPVEARELLGLTWGLPLLLALPAMTSGAPIQFAIAAAISTLVVLFVGEAMLVVRGAGQPERLQHAEDL